VSVQDVLSRIAEIQSGLTPQAAPAAPPVSGAGTQFSQLLQQASGPTGAGAVTASSTGMAVAPAGPLPATSGGAGVLAAAQREVGVAEQPPGSNDSARIGQYRQATAGSGVGPWCAYFTSWAAREAGVPLGDAGQGFGRVDDVWAWAERSGKAIPASGGPPQPGDLIVWDEHIGIVESVGADGAVSTIEGNSSDSVARRSYGADGGGAIGYVRLG
jgi:hypothetical protein